MVLQVCDFMFWYVYIIWKFQISRQTLPFHNIDVIIHDNIPAHKSYRFGIKSSQSWHHKPSNTIPTFILVHDRTISQYIVIVHIIQTSLSTVMSHYQCNTPT